MDIKTADRLCHLNNEFYQKNHAPFSASRAAPWPGWERCLGLLANVGFCGKGGPPQPNQTSFSDASHRDEPCYHAMPPCKHNTPSPPSLSIFDLACGNLRFGAFLASQLPQYSLDFYAVDCCDALLPPDVAKTNTDCPNYGANSPREAPINAQTAVIAGLTGNLSPDPPGEALRLTSRNDGLDTLNRHLPKRPVRYQYQNLDIVELLQHDLCLSEHIAAPLCDLAVCFGFLHHLPLVEQRQQVLQSLIGQTRPGGYVIVSFWQFLNDAGLAAKARESHQHGLAQLGLPGLDDNDFLLGFNGIPGAWRYCHSFTDREIDQLAASLAGQARAAYRFNADGRTGNLNSYLLLEVS
ncbi:MAG: hypothetical protein FWF71_03270 [Actinomycetia bacterium]|nr:hypothetical protein [Actinomycetes bacterium]